MQKIINVCKRIEGHGTVEIYLQNDQISNISFNLSVFRGFENILLNKELLDIPKIASRICGLCHSSQTIASCKAIESLYNIQPSRESILLRRILMIGELIKSHSIHQFLQSLADLLYIFEYKTKQPSPYDLLQFDYELATKFYELINIGNEIDRIFGGRSIHLITPYPGGIIYSHSQNNIKLAKKYIEKAIENLEYIIERYIKLFAPLSPPEIFNIPNPIYMSLHDNESYDRYRGNIGINYEDSQKLNFSVENYSTYFDKDPVLRGINFLNEEIVLVGPLARYHNIKRYALDEVKSMLKAFDNTWKQNILFSNFLKLIEMYVEAKECLNILDDSILNTNEKSNIGIHVQKEEGIGVVEAPRGILIHDYHLNSEQNIDEVKLFIATEINIPLINTMLMNFSKDLYDKTGDIDLLKQKAQMIIRAFDPCISCATH